MRLFPRAAIPAADAALLASDRADIDAGLVAYDEDGYLYLDKTVSRGDHQVVQETYALTVLSRRFGPDTYVGADKQMYRREGDRRDSMAPDLLVAFGAGSHWRKSWKPWEEAATPAFVMEVLSPETWRKDVAEKREFYASLGIEEYWMLDPLGLRFENGLAGLRLSSDGEYHAIMSQVDGSFRSRVLGLDLHLVDEGSGRELRFRDSATGEELLPPWEALGSAEARIAKEAVARRKAEAQAEKEAVARRKAEARLAELLARLDSSSRDTD